MCGIAGAISRDGTPIAAARVHAMLDAMAHRGPDGRGVHVEDELALGHVRLSILDPTPAGAQPMNRDGMLLVHNGEVYNYVELAAQLRAMGERFRTGTDTEVILAAYRVWGLDAVARFNGMYAFALWDPYLRRLVLARDRFGIKPLYVRRTAHAVVFASEVAAFFVGRPVHDGDGWTPEPNPAAVRDFLVRHRTDHSRETFVRGVTSIPPAHLLVIQGGSERLVRYWGPPELADDDRPATSWADRRRDDALVEEFRQRFDDAVRIRLRADVPIGTCLSGGIDSSSIVTTVAQLVEGTSSARGTNQQIPGLGFHARFPDNGIDESGYAEMVARRASIRLICRTPVPRTLTSAVLPVLRAQAEPYGSGSIDAQYAVMDAAHAEGLKVLLDGQGADELLGGYLSYLGVRSAGLLAGGAWRAALRELRAQVAAGTATSAGAIAWMLRALATQREIEWIRDASGGRYGMRCGPELTREPPLSDPAGGGGQRGTKLAIQLWLSMSTNGLPALLRYEDRNSMAFGIEARVPFLDFRLVELATRLPDRLRVDHGVTKVILRRAMRRRVPDAVLARRDKMGFLAPEDAWLRSSHAAVAAVLRGGQVAERGWVERRELERVLASGLMPGRGAAQLWRLFVVEAWLRLFWPQGVAVNQLVAASASAAELAELAQTNC